MIDGKERIDLLREFMEIMKREYLDLFINFKIELKRGYLGGIIGPAQRYLLIEGTYMNRKVIYRFLINPNIGTGGGNTVYFGYIGHSLNLRHKYPKFAITPTIKPICKDIGVTRYGFARFFLWVYMGEKTNSKNLFRRPC